MAFLNPKIALFMKGRKGVFPYIKYHLKDGESPIWIHTASLGEFEQGLPIIKELRKSHQDERILVTFFSPSGYEVKKDSRQADLITYLPLDTKRNAKEFISLTNPKVAIFIKYEIWPNYLKILQENSIPALLVSAKFKKEQIYFKWYGGFMRNALHKFSHIFVQDIRSQELLNSIEITSVTVSGDTRFDRVSEFLEQDNRIDFVEQFLGNNRCLVAGSTWPEDESVLVDFINQNKTDLKFILAPHTIDKSRIEKLKKAISKSVICYSEIGDELVANYDVLIIDTIGLLTKIYYYAYLAYVGGGFSTGLHNTLEPAVYGIPIVIGPNFLGFNEAEELVDLGGIQVISSKEDFNNVILKLHEDQLFYDHCAWANQNYVRKNKGASVQILEYLRTLL